MSIGVSMALVLLGNAMIELLLQTKNTGPAGAFITWFTLFVLPCAIGGSVFGLVLHAFVGTLPTVGPMPNFFGAHAGAGAIAGAVVGIVWFLLPQRPLLAALLLAAALVPHVFLTGRQILRAPADLRSELPSTSGFFMRLALLTIAATTLGYALACVA